MELKNCTNKSTSAKLFQMKKKNPKLLRKIKEKFIDTNKCNKIIKYSIYHKV